jgi:HAD superfamily hydrolase (TIGR01549 family)
MIRAVIFDIDGTMVDSVDAHAEAWQRALASFGHYVAFDKIRSQIGKGGDQLLPVFLSQQEVAERGKEIEEFRADLFKREYISRVLPFPHVRELFVRIKRDDRSIILASSAKADEVEFYKHLCLVENLVDGQTSADDAAKSKQHPDIFEAALDLLQGIGAEETLVVGDSPYDAEAARKAHLSTLGVLCGGFPEEDLLAAGCIAVYVDPADLLARYKFSPLKP